MFDFIRNHTRLVLGFLLLLIVPSFVFFGVQGYSRFSEAGNETVAKVDGVAITRAEWDAAHARNVERVRRQSPDVDVQLLDSPQARRDTLDGMVRERVLLAAAADLQLYPSLSRMAMLFAGAGMWPCSRCSRWSAMPVSPIVMYPGSSGRTA